MENAQVQLFDQMLAVFNEEDIRELCFRLNIVYADLNGQNRRVKTISLVERCQQVDRISELIALCQELRPTVVWPDASTWQSDKLDSATAVVPTAETTPLRDEPTQTPPIKPSVKIPVWVWGAVGLLLLALVILVVWKPWIPVAETAVSPTPTSFSSSSPSNNRIDLNQTVSGKITGSEPQEWTYVGSSGEADIRVDGGPDDTFVIILTYEAGGEAAYIDYSGRGQGELVTYYDLQENMKILVDETENDGADYTLSVTASEPKYLSPNVSFGGELRGANPKYFIFTGYPTPVDIILEMTDAERPLLEVFNPDDTLLISANQVDENGRLALTNLELYGEDDQYDIVIRDQANDGAVYRIEVRESAENEVETAVSPTITQSGETQIRTADEMVMAFAPTGVFLMGSTSSDSNAQRDEMPQHQVRLDSFWIDITEVTNQQYTQCVDAVSCTISSYASNEKFNQPEQPVVGVSWYDAADYCQWAGGQLPTEAQWEYAARSETSKTFPWGEDQPDCTLANTQNCIDSTLFVGSLDSESWLGIKDMAGNVWEWTSDWYDANYYAGLSTSSPTLNPAGPTEGEYKVMRGGSWDLEWFYVRSAYRNILNFPSGKFQNVGFRCVVPVE